MLGKFSQLEGGQELTKIQQKDFENGNLLQRIIDAVNSVAQNLGAAAVGKLESPPPVNSIQVQGVADISSNTITTPNEFLHITLTHNGQIRKGVQYIHEISTEKNFLAPHVIDAGCSRSLFVHLPTFQTDGTTLQTYYHRAYAQYPGSDPAQPTVLGGLAAPTKILMSGTTSATLLSSTGSGTASPLGTQGAHGLGKVLTRSAPGPKRNIL
jgi:hypothetical protein